MFRRAAGAWNFSRHFQCLPVRVVHGRSQFFFPLLSYRSKWHLHLQTQGSFELCLYLFYRNSNKLLLLPQSQKYLAFGQSFTFFVEIDAKYRAVLQRPFCWIFGSREQREPFHLTRNVSGISNRKFCLNGKRPRY